MRFLMTTTGGSTPDELSKRFWKIVGDGESDVRQVFGPD